MTEKPGPLRSNEFLRNVLAGVLASLLFGCLIVVFSPFVSLLPAWAQASLSIIVVIVGITVLVPSLRRKLWRPLGGFFEWVGSLRLTHRPSVDLPKLVSLIVKSPDVLITGFVPRELMEELRKSTPDRDIPRIKLLTPKRALIYDETPQTRAQQIAWQNGVLGLSNYIGGLSVADGGPRRGRELGDFILDMEKRFTGCVVLLGKRRRSFTVTALPEHHPGFPDEVTVVTEIFGTVKKDAEAWVNAMLIDAKPVRMREVLCSQVPNLTATGTNGTHRVEPPFEATRLATYGLVSDRSGFLVPRAAVIAKYDGPSVLLGRRNKLNENGDQGKLTILTQRIQDIDLLEVAKRSAPEGSLDPSEGRQAEGQWKDAGTYSLESYRRAFRVERNQPFVLPLAVYRAAAVREAMLSLGIPDADDRLQYESFAVLDDPKEKCQKGFAIFTIELKCDLVVDEVERALDLNRRQLVKADKETVAAEIATDTANDLLRHRWALISELAF